MYDVEQQVNGWEWVKRADGTWSVKRKEKREQEGHISNHEETAVG
jgi:hypothetical protein